MLRDTDRDGKVDEQSDLLTELNSPFGVVWADGTLYVAATDAILAYPYTLGQAAITAASTVLTSLAGDVVGRVASVPGGPELAGAVVEEIGAIAAAERRPLAAGLDGLRRTLTDTTSGFAPSLTRELWAGRPVEIEVLDDLATRARRHGLASPLLDGALVRLHLAS